MYACMHSLSLERGYRAYINQRHSSLFFDLLTTPLIFVAVAVRLVDYAMANNTPGQSHGDSGANEEAELTNNDGGNRNNNSLMSTTTTTGGTTDAAGASGTLTIDPVDATLGNSGNVDNVAESATDGTDGATSLSIGFCDVSTGETVPLVPENSSGGGDESGVVPGEDDAMSTATTESPSQAIGGDVPVSGDASNKAIIPGKDGVNKKKSGGRKRKGADRTETQDDMTTFATISEHAKALPRTRKPPEIYSPPIEKKTRRQPTSPSKPGNTGADARLSKAASNEASKDESDEESEEKSKAPSDEGDEQYSNPDEDVSSSANKSSSSSVVSIGFAPWKLNKEIADLNDVSSHQEVIDVDEEDIAVPFDPTQFMENDNIEQKLILASSTCVFNIHFLPLSVLVHSTEQYLFCKSARCYLEFFNILDIF